MILDGNAGVSRAAAGELVRGLKARGIEPALVEQWLAKDDLAGARALGEESGWLVAADESVTSAADARRVAAVLLVAPADPDKFGVAPLLPTHGLDIDSVLIASETDPWMTYGKAAGWARCWGSTLINLGDAGHINVDSGHGALPVAMAVVRQMTGRTRRTETSARDAAADVALEVADEFGLVADQFLHHVAH